MTKIIPIKSAPLDALDDFSDLYADVKGASDHELALALGSVKPPRLPFRSVHPAVRQFPHMPNAEYEKLHDDIRQNGQRKAICMYQGMIWDGRARYDACVDLGLVPRVWPLRREDPIVYLLHRHRDRFGLPHTAEREAALVLLREVRSTEWRQQAQKRRAEWIALARSEFQKYTWRSPKPCAVCGLSSEYSHSHHSLPLQLQYELGVDEAIQEYDWLCPVHHKLIHQHIAARLVGTRYSDGDDYHHRYKSDAERVRAQEALDTVFAKAHRLFCEVGGVATAGNWAMLAP